MSAAQLLNLFSVDIEATNTGTYQRSCLVNCGNSTSLDELDSADFLVAKKHAVKRRNARATAPKRSGRKSPKGKRSAFKSVRNPFIKTCKFDCGRPSTRSARSQRKSGAPKKSDLLSLFDINIEASNSGTYQRSCLVNCGNSL